MDNIEAALQDLSLQDPPNITATARRYEINRSTLSRRYNGVTTSAEVKAQKQQLLSPPQEQSLVDYINKLTEDSLPPTVQIVRNFAKEIAQQEPSRNWSHRFCKR